ncbi:MAG: hypothetical protein ACTS6G_06235 [Candidatus Hodgkinia cicadicola]
MKLTSKSAERLYKLFEVYSLTPMGVSASSNAWMQYTTTLDYECMDISSVRTVSLRALAEVYNIIDDPNFVNHIRRSATSNTKAGCCSTFYASGAWNIERFRYLKCFRRISIHGYWQFHRVNMFY